MRTITEPSPLFIIRTSLSALSTWTPCRGAHAQYGWISLLYLREDYRSRGFGIQLLARPLRDYADMQRNALRLLVSSDNERALKFYKRCGFRQLSTQPGAAGSFC